MSVVNCSEALSALIVGDYEPQLTQNPLSTFPSLAQMGSEIYTVSLAPLSSQTKWHWYSWILSL
jgi:hypothetical protein